MKKWSFVALLLVGATVLGATVLREPIASAAPAILQVFVTNDAANPVPVHEQGTANVLDVAARHAVRGRALFVIPDPSPSQNAILYTVPAGKRLVIEYLSAIVTGASDVPLVEVGAQLSAGDAPLPMTYSGQAGLVPNPRYVASEQVRLYADAGENILASASRSSGTSGDVLVEVEFDGYLIDP
jgi:hypothetical protein